MPGLGIGPGTAFRQDVLAARPPAVPSLQGYFFFATDVDGGTLYQCTGSGWLQITNGQRTLVAGDNISIVSTPTTITISSAAAPYSLPIASSTVLGGVKVGSGLFVDLGGTLSATIISPLTTKGDLWGFSTVNARLPAGTDGYALVSDSSQPLGLKWGSPTSTGAITFEIFGAGSIIGAGIAGDLLIPFDCTISKVTMLSDVTTNAVVDIWKSNYAGYPPTVTNTITGSAIPTLIATTKMQNSTLTGWTTVITAGDILRFNTNSCSAATRIVISLQVTG